MSCYYRASLAGLSAVRFTDLIDRSGAGLRWWGVKPGLLGCSLSSRACTPTGTCHHANRAQRHGQTTRRRSCAYKKSRFGNPQAPLTCTNGSRTPIMCPLAAEVRMGVRKGNKYQ